MLSSYQKFKVRRFIKQRLKNGFQLSEIQQWFSDHIVEPWHKLKSVRRFFVGWLSLVLILIIGLLAQFSFNRSVFFVEKPARGGVYQEGVIGRVDNINPIFASNEASRSAVGLIFNGLLQYDKNGELVPEVASSIRVNDEGTEYTVKLRDDVYWHDDKPLTARDVVYTFTQVADENVDSPLFSSWKGVTSKAVNDTTVVFTLPNSFPPFIYSLTTGILPEHILKDVKPSDLRTASFNQHPVGTGPFRFAALGNGGQQLQLESNKNYFKKRPLLDRFVLLGYKTKNELQKAFSNGQLTAASNIDPKSYKKFEKEDVITRNLRQYTSIFLFFNTTKAPYDDVQVRTALTEASDPAEIKQKTSAPFRKIDGPLISEQLGYVANKPMYAQQEKALDTLKQAGWEKNTNGIMEKDGQKLEPVIFTQKDTILVDFAKELQEQWQEIGVSASVRALDSSQLQQKIIIPREFDTLLYGLEIGADPDQFAFWHSSQVGKKGINISNYSNKRVDESLEAGRTRQDLELRKAKYAAFQKQWLVDAPAIPLFQQSLLYVSKPGVTMVEDQTIGTISSRYRNVQDWSVKSDKQLPK
jgi:peptide/nickel transport system substrate-binding protein